MPQTSLSTDAAASSLGVPPPFVCSWNPDASGSAWVHLQGELDLAMLPRFQTVLQEAQSTGSTVVIDLQELCFIDCAALQAIVDADALAREQEMRLVLVGGHGQVDRLLRLTGVLERVEAAE